MYSIGSNLSTALAMIVQFHIDFSEHIIRQSQCNVYHNIIKLHREKFLKGLNRLFGLKIVRAGRLQGVLFQDCSRIQQGSQSSR